VFFYVCLYRDLSIVILASSSSFLKGELLAASVTLDKIGLYRRVYEREKKRMILERKFRKLTGKVIYHIIYFSLSLSLSVVKTYINFNNNNIE
jgi:hypothetical protein